jgi:hypothetical protein
MAMDQQMQMSVFGAEAAAQQNMFHNVMNYVGKFNIKNEFLNTIMKLLIMIHVVRFTNSLTRSTPDFQFNLSEHIMAAFKLLYKYRPFFKSNIRTYKAIIERIDRKRHANPLYDAYWWYLSQSKESQPNSTSEPGDVIYLSVSDKITTKRLPSVYMSIGENEKKEFVFRGVTIRYSLQNVRIDVNTEDGIKQKNNDQIVMEWDWPMHSTDPYDIIHKLDKVVLSEYSMHEDSKDKCQEKFRYTNHKWTSYGRIQERDIESIIIQPLQREILLNELHRFIHEPDWYGKHGFPYSIGMLLHGPPGCGKTSLINQVATYTKRSIHYLHLNNFQSDADFISAISSIPIAYSIVVIEEVDTFQITHSRSKARNEKRKSKDSNAKQEKEISLGTILGFLDGELSRPGQIIILTSNYPQKLDEALIRDGRITINFHMGKCDVDAIELLFTKFYSRCPTTIEKDLINQLPAISLSPSTVMNTFRIHRDPVQSLQTLVAAISIPSAEVSETPDELDMEADPEDSIKSSDNGVISLDSDIE